MHFGTDFNLNNNKKSGYPSFSLRQIATFSKIVRNVVAQGKSDKLTEIDRQKSLRNKNELLELKSRNQGRITLATQKQH